ncbi:MAG: transposase [Chlorobiaceae bacterium]
MRGGTLSPEYSAWALKHIFREFWKSATKLRAEVFFAYWCELVARSGLKPLIKVKELMEQHKENIFNYFKHKVSNAVSEGLNSKIQLLKTKDYCSRVSWLRKLPDKNPFLLWKARYENIVVPSYEI